MEFAGPINGASCLVIWMWAVGSIVTWALVDDMRERPTSIVVPTAIALAWPISIPLCLVLGAIGRLATRRN